MEDGGAKYCEDYILRKEGRSKWIQYWVVIRGVWMLFYSDKGTTDSRDNFRGSIELTSTTKCNIAKRRNYSFPFYISTERGTHLFKCDTNLKRHQWLYLIGLAVKGVPPTPPPSSVPSPSVLVTQREIIPQSAPTPDLEELDFPDSETDEDDCSLPPDVILVTTPIDELSHNEDLSRTANNNTREKQGSTKDPRQQHVFSRAVLTTGITGATTVVQEPRKTYQSPQLRVDKYISRSLELAKGDHAVQRKSPTSLHPDSLSLHSSLVWNRGSPERPSTSPSPTLSPKDSTHQSMLSPVSRGNMKFSRYMARSAPDIKMMSLDDPT